MPTENEVFTLISPAEAKEKIDAGAAVVDTRPPGDWAGGHIPGAQNLPLISIRGRSREIAEGVEVIFVCQDGARAPQAAETAKTGITVNAICPGFTETELLAEAVANIVDKTGSYSLSFGCVRFCLRAAFHAASVFSTSPRRLYTVPRFKNGST